MGKKRRKSGGLPRPSASGAGRRAGSSASVAPASRPVLPRWKRIALRAALAVGGPVVLLVVVEALLRLGGCGHPTTFFVKTEDGKTLTTNRRFAWRFMPREAATQPSALLLPARKPPGATRLFVLGESAAQGTPAPAFGFARILEVMLREQFPSNRFEVVNAAMRGLNSHAILPIAEECAGLEPDLFLVYLGNNETVGLHAPEPGQLNLTPHLRLLRLSQWARTTKLAQWMENTARVFRTKPRKRPEQDMEFFRKSRLAADDPRRAAVYDNFRANLTDLCRVTRQSGAPVIVSTLAVNLRDFPPLASLHRADLPAADLARWQTAYGKGTNAELRGQMDAAVTNYLEAARLDDQFAELHFRLARCYVAAGLIGPAAPHFGLARDWDALQFRADGRQNRIIREIVESTRDTGLKLIEADRVFAKDPGSENGIPGRHFFHEHVHLTFDGDYLLARTFLAAVTNALGLVGPSRPVPSRSECAEALAFTEWDEIGVAAAMLRMTARPPFLDQVDHAQRQAQDEAAVQRRNAAFQQPGAFPRAVTVYRAALARWPDDWQIHVNFGNLWSDFRNPANAAPEFEAAVKLMPGFLPMRVALANAWWELGRREAATAQLREALRQDPEYGPAQDGLRAVAR